MAYAKLHMRARRGMTIPAQSARSDLAEATVRRPGADLEGFLLGGLGVLSFSMTLPATRAAVADLDGTVVGLGRALIAAALAALTLIWRRQPWPARHHLPGLALAAAGVVIGFPLLSAWAVERVEAAHAAVLTGLLPLGTALGAVLLAGERPSRAFWGVSLLGLAAVIGFAASMGGGLPQLADLLLLGAVAAAGLGYAAGGRLARELGGWQVICWALMISAPFIAVPVGLKVATQGLHASPQAWLGFLYVGVVSMFLGFFAWYRGLAQGGIAAVGQLQLLQPFFGLALAATLLREEVSLLMLVVTVAVAACVAGAKKFSN
jgi:drug/metabolite transporter (DMT)-like permease